MKQGKRVDKHIVYWYGETACNLFYSYVSDKMLITLAKAQDMGLGGRDGNARRELQEDLAKDPTDRKRGAVGFVEDFETPCLGLTQ